MNSITLLYKKPEWGNNQWVSWRCRDRDEAVRISNMLVSRGYEVRGL